jgi:hypothetical protein
MAIQLVNLRINRVIAHQIFERSVSDDVKEPKCSTQCTRLPPGGINALQTRIIEAVGNDSHSIQMYISQNGVGSVYDYCNRLLGSDDSSFIAISQELAKKLAYSQTSRNIPGGILVVFDGLLGDNNTRIIGLIKAEIQEGFGIESRTNTLLLNYIAELLLTPSQKFYKIGLFVETEKPASEELRVPECYEIIVYDHNLITKQEAAQAAKYFYESFLGCTFSPSAKKLTKDFYYHTREYIEKLPIEKEDKLDLHDSLYSYLKVSQSNVVEVSNFAREYLTPEFRDGYRAYMIDNKVPENAITKDIEYIKNKLKQRHVHFTSQVTITGPSEKFSDLVDFRGTENDRTMVAIKGKIERTE